MVLFFWRYEFPKRSAWLGLSLTGLDVRPSPLSSTRKIVEVMFSYTNRGTDAIEKLFARVDVTEEFPFLVTKLSPYYNR